MLDSFIAAVLALIGLAGTETAKRVITRRNEEVDLTRDALVDFAMTLGSVESILDDLISELPPASYADLPGFCSGYDLFPTTISLDRMLSVFNDERLHCLLMRFSDRYRIFDSVSKERIESYRWLLDNPGVDWKEPRAAERIENVRASTGKLREAVEDIAAFGYEILEILYNQKLARFSFIRGDHGACSKFIEETYGLTSHTIAHRRAYYAMLQVPEAFSTKREYDIVVWNDAVARELPRRSARLEIVVDIGGRQLRYSMRPLVQSALPRGSTFVEAIVVLADGSRSQVQLDFSSATFSLRAGDVSKVLGIARSAPQPRLLTGRNAASEG